MRIDELIPQLESCDYECEAGNLKCNIAFRQLKHIVERLVEIKFKISGIPNKKPEWLTNAEYIDHIAQIKLMNYILTGADGKDTEKVNEILIEMGYKI